MLNSMTGYGKFDLDSDMGQFSAEVHCLNKRHLEVTVSLPRALLFLEPEVKGWVKNSLFRGLIHVSLFVSLNERSSLKVTPNISLAKAYHSAWGEMMLAIGEKIPFPAEKLIESKDFFSCHENYSEEEKEVLKNHIQEAFEKAMEQVLSVRLSEGAKIANDLHQYVDQIAALANTIPNYCEEAKEKWDARLHKSLEKVKGSLSESDQDRAIRELALISEKMDITEELQRLSYHIQSFKELINDPQNASKGKRIEFLVQEMHREVNTLSSKSTHRAIANTTIEMKSYLEKIREQVQNVE